MKNNLIYGTFISLLILSFVYCYVRYDNLLKKYDDQRSELGIYKNIILKHEMSAKIKNKLKFSTLKNLLGNNNCDEVIVVYCGFEANEHFFYKILNYVSSIKEKNQCIPIIAVVPSQSDTYLEKQKKMLLDKNNNFKLAKNSNMLYSQIPQKFISLFKCNITTECFEVTILSEDEIFNGDRINDFIGS